MTAAEPDAAPLIAPPDPNVTEDSFLGGRLVLRQPAKGFRGGLDAVILAASVPSGTGHRILDVGAGVGTAGLCVAARLPDKWVTLVERSPALAALARHNGERNGFVHRVRVIEADVTGRAADHRAVGLLAESFDHIIANPPYLDPGRHRLPEEEIAAASFGMDAAGLEHWIRFMARMAAPGGTISMIHRADALANLLAALNTRFGGIHILPLHPRAGDPAHRLIVTARKSSRAPLVLLPGLVLHGEGNAFLPAIAAVLREGAPLAMLGGAAD